MAQTPNTEPRYRVEIADLLESYNQHKADEAAAKADGVKAQLETLLVDCDVAQVAGSTPRLRVLAHIAALCHTEATLRL